jgi:hypothetical protein
MSRPELKIDEPARHLSSFDWKGDARYRWKANWDIEYLEGSRTDSRNLSVRI